MTRIFNGMIYLLQGFQLLKHPNIRLYVIIPLCINIVVFSLLMILALYEFRLFTQWLENYLPQWLNWLMWLLWLIFLLSTLSIVALTFTFAANIICAPFNGFLAEKVEEHLLGRKTTPQATWLTLVKDLPRMLAREGHKIIYYLPRACGLLILFLIPVINILAGLIWFLFNAWMMTLQYIDYPMDNHHIEFKQMKSIMQQHKQSAIGFGSLALLLTLIPIINFFVMPAAVVGGTVMWVNEYAHLE